MPLDGRGFRLPVEVEPFKGGREGLAQLSAALRREMPPSFAWNFGVIHVKSPCGSAGCALGLAIELWPSTRHDLLSGEADLLCGCFGISGEAAVRFFCDTAYRVPWQSVTPTMVADRIDHWLATGEIK